MNIGSWVYILVEKRNSVYLELMYKYKNVKEISDWEGKGPCAIVPLTLKMAHKSLCRMIRNCPLKNSKSLKKAENGPFGKNLFPITEEMQNYDYISVI